MRLTRTPAKCIYTLYIYVYVVFLRILPPGPYGSHSEMMSLAKE